MDSARLIRAALLVSIVCGVIVSLSGAARAGTPPEFVDPHPAAGNQFGQTVIALTTGNVVITSPFDDAGATDAGAVYLFNGATGALISTVRGSSVGDNIGAPNVVPLANGNFVIRSTLWNNGAIADVGAVTWGSGTTGVSGVISPANSLVGSTAGDAAGGGGVTALTNGNYVVVTTGWDNGAAVNAGEATWGSGTTGVSGAISAANSLIGSTANDNIGSNGVISLTNGNYVVLSTNWDNGAAANAGAATWGSGTIGVKGVVSAANSLVGSTANDNIGSSGAQPLANGNYVVRSPNWDNGAVLNVGAATWCNGLTGRTGVVSAANSLVGSTASDNVGLSGITALTSGNYVIRSSSWDNGAIADAGAATWCNGLTGRTGVITAANSLVGSTATDNVGIGGTALTNGNYVVTSSNWNNGGVVDAGAATWGDGTTGVTGVISAANSLVGSTANNFVGTGAIALTNGNYVVTNLNWDNGAVLNVGAATWGNGTTGVAGTVSAVNSLIGTTTGDGISSGGVTALTNGNYVVRSSNWDNGGVLNAGAVTWGNGTTGVAGTVSPANSLVGSTANDAIGTSGVTALTNGNYVVGADDWDNGAIVDAGAATWGSGTSGVIGSITPFNSLVGFSTNDHVSSTGVVALTYGNYVVRSPSWSNGTAVSAGAVTWGNGTAGVTGAVTIANSLVGSTANDQVGVVTALANGNYAVRSSNWDNGALANAGAATWGSGTIGVTGVVSTSNSLVGTSASSSLTGLTEDVVNETFFGRFVTEGGGRVRIGPLDFSPVNLDLVDIPDDQGGWLRLSFTPSGLDQNGAAIRIATYGIWRRLPELLAGGAGPANRAQRLDPADTEHLRASVPTGLDVREVDGRFYVTGRRQPTTGITAAFPEGVWEYVAGVPALQAQQVVAVPTISNAEPNDFVVTAHTTEPSIWFISNPVSAQSVDNLAPASPSPFTAAYASGATHLHWGVNNEPDIGLYNVYRGATAGFIPALPNRISSSADTGSVDPGPAGSYYKLSAVDVNGNESVFALITPGTTVGVSDDLPVAFALDGVWPNPSRGNGLRVAFALPTGADARFELMDVSGRRVLVREVGSMGPGRHMVNLVAGRKVAPGLYWLRLTQATNQRTTRVTVIE